MKLYYKPGACSLASHIVLHELGISFEIEKADTEAGLTETGKQFATISPNGYVPAVDIGDGVVITENPAILQYLGGLRPALHLVPEDGSLERIRLQEVLNFLSSELAKAYGPYFSNVQMTEDEKKVTDLVISRRIGAIENRLADNGPYLFGANFTVADAYAFVVLNWSFFTNFDLAAWTHVSKFVERVKNRPATIQAMTAEGLL